MQALITIFSFVGALGLLAWTIRDILTDLGEDR